MNSKSSHQKPEKTIGKLSLGSTAKGRLLSHAPSSNSLAIGQSMGTLFTELNPAEALPQEILALGEELQRYNESQLQYVDATLLENVSCPHAIKKWAFERMQELKIPYEMKNRLKPAQIEENADENATLKLLDLAEDFLQIASFSRNLEAMQIEMAPHAGGMEFIFEFLGQADRIAMRTIEDKALDLFFKKYSRENSMRLRANVSDEFVEMQIVVFKKQLRLGMSPVD